MPKLTRRSLGITEGYCSNYQKDDIVQKLGYIEHVGVGLAEDACSHICKYSHDATSEEMDSICAACPVTRLMEMMD